MSDLQGQRLSGIELERAIIDMLLGDPDGFDAGMTLVDMHYKEDILGAMGRRYDHISPWDLDDAWQRTLLGLMKRIRKGKFRKSGSLRGLLHKMCRRKLLDILLSRRRAQCKIYRYFRNVAEINRLHPEYGIFDLDTLATEDIYQAMCVAIDALPRVQHLVWRTFRDLGFVCQSKEQLHLAVLEATDYDGSIDAVRKAYDRGERRILAYLRRKGLISEY